MKFSIPKVVYFFIVFALLVLCVLIWKLSPIYLLLALLMVPFLIKRTVPVISKDEALPTYPELSEEACTVMGFLAVHYDSPKMSMAYLSSMLAMKEEEIESIFRDEMHSSFEKELDVIRSAEARRLRKTGRLSIKEVAEFVGCSSEDELLETEARATEEED